MNVNIVKLAIAGMLAAACIVAMAFDGENISWAGPVLTLLVGYVIGNSQVSSQTGNVAPILSLPSKLPHPSLPLVEPRPPGEFP